MSEATNGTDCQHDGDDGMTEEQKKQKELDDMAAASSDTEFEQLLSEVGCSTKSRNFSNDESSSVYSLQPEAQLCGSFRAC